MHRRWYSEGNDPALGNTDSIEFCDLISASLVSSYH